MQMLLIASCSILTILAAVFVLRPLFRESENRLDILLMAETEADRLVDRKAAIYGNLKDLTLEYQMGRLSEEDFRTLEAGYKADAASILQKLEQMGVSESFEASIEEDIASRRKPQQTDKSGRMKNRALCPSCGADVIPGKKFCADCGQKL
jgi:hypothetical protein